MIDIDREFHFAQAQSVSGIVTAKNDSPLIFDNISQSVEIAVWDNPVIIKFSPDGKNFGPEMELKNYELMASPPRLGKQVFHIAAKAIKIRNKHYKKVAKCMITFKF